MVQIATAITFAATLVGFAMGKDHSSHNCCLNTPEGWRLRNDWTRMVCEETYGSVATFDGIKCIEKPGNTISGDDFYTACKLKGNVEGYGEDWQKGAGYRGTCS